MMNQTQDGCAEKKTVMEESLMSKNRFALGLYSVRKSLSEDMPGTLKTVAELGYEGVEFFGGFTHEAEVVKKALLNTGLAIAGWHTPWSEVQPERISETIAYFKTIGNKNVIIPGLPAGMLATRDACIETAGKFNAIAAELDKHGMRIGYHNHESELPFFPGTPDCPFTVFFDHTDPSVIVQMDNGNALCGRGAGVLSLLRRYPNRYRTVHLKPYSFEKGAVEHAAGFETMIGEDDIPWMDFMNLCKTVGGTEWFIVEYESEKMYPELEGVERSLKALKEMEASGLI